MHLQKNGWLREARRVPAAHQDSRPDADGVSLLVVHCISLPRGSFGGGAIVDLLRGKPDCKAHPVLAPLKHLRVSAHFLIRRGGELIQFVPCRKRAWHAGESRWRGRKQCNDFSVGAEREGADDSPYPPPQYNTLANLYFALAEQYAPLSVAGHEHIAPGRKTDPGPAFDWKILFDKIGKENDGRAAAI